MLHYRLHLLHNSWLQDIIKVLSQLVHCKTSSNNFWSLHCLDNEVSWVHVPSDLNSHRSQIRDDLWGRSLIDLETIVHHNSSVHQPEKITGWLMDSADNSHAHTGFSLDHSHNLQGSSTIETTSGLI